MHMSVFTTTEIVSNEIIGRKVDMTQQLVFSNNVLATHLENLNYLLLIIRVVV